MSLFALVFSPTAPKAGAAPQPTSRLFSQANVYASQQYQQAAAAKPAKAVNDSVVPAAPKGAKPKKRQREEQQQGGASGDGPGGAAVAAATAAGNGDQARRAPGAVKPAGSKKAKKAQEQQQKQEEEEEVPRQQRGATTAGAKTVPRRAKPLPSRPQQELSEEEQEEEDQEEQEEEQEEQQQVANGTEPTEEDTDSDQPDDPASDGKSKPKVRVVMDRLPHQRYHTGQHVADRQACASLPLFPAARSARRRRRPSGCGAPCGWATCPPASAAAPRRSRRSSPSEPLQRLCTWLRAARSSRRPPQGHRAWAHSATHLTQAARASQHRHHHMAHTRAAGAGRWRRCACAACPWTCRPSCHAAWPSSRARCAGQRHSRRRAQGGGRATRGRPRRAACRSCWVLVAVRTWCAAAGGRHEGGGVRVRGVQGRSGRGPGSGAQHDRGAGGPMSKPMGVLCGGAHDQTVRGFNRLMCLRACAASLDRRWTATTCKWTARRCPARRRRRGARRRRAPRRAPSTTRSARSFAATCTSW